MSCPLYYKLHLDTTKACIKPLHMILYSRFIEGVVCAY